MSTGGIVRFEFDICEARFFSPVGTKKAFNQILKQGSDVGELDRGQA